MLRGDRPTLRQLSNLDIPFRSQGMDYRVVRDRKKNSPLDRLGGGSDGEGDGESSSDLGIATATLIRGGWRLRDIGELSFLQFCWVVENVQKCSIVDSRTAVQMERLAIASCLSKEGDEAFRNTLKQFDKIVG